MFNHSYPYLVGPKTQALQPLAPQENVHGRFSIWYRDWLANKAQPSYFWAKSQAVT